jgi:uncharacterized protein (DUF2235 family)
MERASSFAAFEPDALDAPYREKWFPGVHGSVGGGSNVPGLSDGALNCVLTGAKSAGLRLDTERGSRIHGFKPDALAPVINVSRPSCSFTQINRPGTVFAVKGGETNGYQEIQDRSELG